MFQWRVILLSVLAVILQLAGLLSLALPQRYEGPMLYAINEQHSIYALDGLGAILLLLGCLVAWSAGAVWQRQMYGSE
jgi:hypothetical protein